MILYTQMAFLSWINLLLFSLVCCYGNFETPHSKNDDISVGFNCFFLIKVAEQMCETEWN